MSWLDTTLQVIGAVASLATVVGVVLWALNRKKVLIHSRLFNIRVLDNPLAERVSVLLDGEPIDNPSLSAIRVWNGGFSPIRPEDFAEPLRILSTLGRGFVVVNVDGINGPVPDYRIEDTTLLLDRVTLSRKQGFEVRALMNDFGVMGVMGRLHNGYIESAETPLRVRWWRRLRS